MSEASNDQVQSNNDRITAILEKASRKKKSSQSGSAGTDDQDSGKTESQQRIASILNKAVDHDRGKKRLNLNDLDEDAKKKKMAKMFEKRMPKPFFVRPNNYLRIQGMNLIIRRNEHGSAMSVIGKAYRRLPTDLDVEIALKNNKMVAQWGNKYFLYSRVPPDIGKPILKDIWAGDVKRGIPIPEASDYDKETLDF